MMTTTNTARAADLPDWARQLAPKDAQEAWVAQRWALLTRHVVALRLGLSPDERKHWDESWRRHVR